MPESTDPSANPPPDDRPERVEHPHSATLRRLEQASGKLAAAAITRMDEQLAWYRAMPPENRSWIGLVAQAGIAAFTEWFRHPETPQAISTDVFGTAPRELTRAITLRQTVELVRTTIEVVEAAIDEVAAPGDESVLREALLVYAREIAFATAQVYAQAAEARGAWDARLESLVVNAVLSGEADEGAVSRAAALGWNSPEHVAVVLGTAPDGDSELTVEAIRRAARHAKLQVLTGVLGNRLVVIAGGSDDPLRAAKSLIGPFAAGSRRGRAGGRRPAVGDRFGAGGRRRTARLRGMAGRPAAGARGRPAAGARDGGRPHSARPLGGGDLQTARRSGVRAPGDAERLSGAGE